MLSGFQRHSVPTPQIDCDHDEQGRFSIVYLDLSPEINTKMAFELDIAVNTERFRKPTGEMSAYTVVLRRRYLGLHDGRGNIVVNPPPLPANPNEAEEEAESWSNLRRLAEEEEKVEN